MFTDSSAGTESFQFEIPSKRDEESYEKSATNAPKNLQMSENTENTENTEDNGWATQRADVEETLKYAQTEKSQRKRRLRGSRSNI